jgi:fructokinase
MARPRSRVLIFGEALCDLFAPTAGTPLEKAPHLVPHQGGAPANVAVQLARLGVPVALWTGVGNDPLGARIVAGLRREGVDTRLMQRLAGRRTGVTLVEVDLRGERRFFPFREQSADLALTTDDLAAPAVQKALRRAAIVHTGTVTMRSASTRRVTRLLQQQAIAQGTLVSIDVNLRPGMFPSLPALLRLARTALRRAHIVKATREEAALLLDLPQATPLPRLLLGLLDRGPRLALVTLDKDGAAAATAAAQVRVKSPRTRVVDATGAGDAFMGALLAGVANRGIDVQDLAGLDEPGLESLLQVAAWAGSRAITALGATTAMATAADHRRRWS